jgi:IS30 family transposase
MANQKKQSSEATVREIRRRTRRKFSPEEKIQNEVLDLALEHTDLSPRELACRYTDENRYFVSESSVYRFLKSGGNTRC